MKNPAQASKRLSALFKKIGTVPPPDVPGADDPIGVLVMSFLLWESTTDKARAAYDRLLGGAVDFNDVRVCMPHETLELIGPRYPRALERCERMRFTLRDLYLREHAMNLDKLADTGKREARKYIESLEGIVPYVAARVLLLKFDTHAIPVDDQLRTMLIEAEVSDDSVDSAELSNWLSAHVRAADGPAAHYALQCWVDQRTGRGERKAPAKKTRRKATSKR